MGQGLGRGPGAQVFFAIRGGGIEPGDAERNEHWPRDVLDGERRSGCRGKFLMAPPPRSGRDSC